MLNHINHQQQELSVSVQDLQCLYQGLTNQLSQVGDQTQLIFLQLNKKKIFRRYLYCRLMSELTFGRRKKKYKREKHYLKTLLKQLSNLQKFSPPSATESHDKQQIVQETPVRQVWDLTQEEAATLSYYPNQDKKSIETIRKELKFLCQPGNGAWDNATTVSHYFQFGLDRAESRIEDYIFWEKYNKARAAEQPAYAALLKHKGYTAALLHQAGLSVSCSLGKIDSEGFVCKPGLKDRISLKELLLQSPEQCYFCKPVDGYQSQNCYKVEYNGSIVLNNEAYSDEEAYKILSDLTIEPYLKQHHKLNELYAQAISSIRIVTICRNNEITVYSRVIRIGSEGSHATSMALGAIAVEIDNNGTLCSLGHKSKKPNFGKFTHHPDTGIQFQGFQLPMWPEVIKLAKDAHTVLDDIPSIGWDIAITENGPIIMEANNQWSISMAQCNSPHKALFDRYFSHLL